MKKQIKELSVYMVHILTKIQFFSKPKELNKQYSKSCISKHNKYFLRFSLFYFLIICVFCNYVCVSVCGNLIVTIGAGRGQQKMPDVLELALQKIVSYQTWVLGTDSGSLPKQYKPIISVTSLHTL